MSIHACKCPKCGQLLYMLPQDIGKLCWECLEAEKKKTKRTS